MLTLVTSESSSSHSNGHIHGEVLHCTEVENVNQLYQATAEIGNWDRLCSNLGIGNAKMEELRHSSGKNEEKKRECLQTYFDTGEAYWEEVVRALIKHPINNKRLGMKLVEQYRLRTDKLLDESCEFHCNKKSY